MVFLYSFDFYFKLRWLNMISLFLNSDIFDEIYYTIVNLVMVKNIILCSNLSITVIKQNFWKKGHPVATYPYKSNLQYN